MANIFKDKLVLVSGAGSGIGKEIALCFAKAGASIAFFDKNSEKVRQVRDELENLEVKVVAEVVDVTNNQQVNAFFETMESEFGSVDVLINNVGLGLVKRFFETKDPDFDLVLSTNFKGPFFLTQKVARNMKEGSSIIFITSIHARHPSLDPTYDASKAAINSLVTNLALDLANRGIRVNAVAPGHIDTKSNGVPRAQEDVPFGKKAGLPADIAQACLFLADSVKAHYITGVVLPVTGGLYIPKAADIKL